jgi:acetyl esterase/lipase
MSFDQLIPQSPINPKADIYAAVALELSRGAAARMRTALDIAYGPDPAHRLDIYLPPQPVTGAPVLLYLHGGGWTHGYKEWCGFNALPFADVPAIVVSADYRLAPAHRLPAAIDDAADAVAWLWRNIALFGGDPDRIFIAGHSAGGHIASMVTLQRALLAGRGLPPDAIKACFPVSCSYNLHYPNPAPGSGEEKTVTQVLASPSDGPAMSPVNHVQGNRTPFFVSWGSEDLQRALVLGPQFLAALGREDCRVEHHVFEPFDHFEIHLDQIRPQSIWVEKVKSWMSGIPAK